jgi:hypothetical protein
MEGNISLYCVDMVNVFRSMYTALIPRKAEVGKPIKEPVTRLILFL